MDTNVLDLVGTYNFVGDDGHFVEFLKAIGVGLIMRTLVSNLKPDIIIRQASNDSKIAIETVSTFKTTVIEFKLGEEFEEKRMDDVVCKSIIKREGNKLIHTQLVTPPVIVERLFEGDKMTTTCRASDVVSIRTYKKAAASPPG